MGIQINGQTDTISAVDGSITVATDLTVPGALTYDDVTNIDSVGIITARQGIRVTSGYVGIGTDITDRQLAVYHATQGTIEIKSSDTGQSSLWFSDISDGNVGGVYYEHSNNAMGFRANDVERLRITSTGDVGINKNAPTSVLDVRQTNTGAATEIKLFNLDQSNATTQTAALVMTPDVRANGVKIVAVKEVADMSSTANKDLALTFQTVENNAAAEKLRITSAGLVGVSTASPEAKLHLYNGISGAADADGSGILVIENSNHASIQFKTPTDKKGLIFFGDADSATSGRIEYDHNNDSMVVNTAGSTRLKLNTGGATITGICTATSFVGSGANLTGLPAGFTELDAALFN